MDRQPVFMNWKTTLQMNWMTTLHKMMYVQIQHNSYKNSNLFAEMEKAILKFKWNYDGP